MSLRRTIVKTRLKTMFSPTKIWLIASSPRRDSFHPSRRLERGRIPCFTPPRATFRLVRCPLRRQPGYRRTHIDRNTCSLRKLARCLATCTGASHLFGDRQSLPKVMVRTASSFQATCSYCMGGAQFRSRESRLGPRSSNTACKLLAHTIKACSHQSQASPRQLQPKACPQPRVASLPQQRDFSRVLAWSRCQACLA